MIKGKVWNASTGSAILTEKNKMKRKRGFLEFYGGGVETLATIKDVARKANVSISTVSHVINQTKHVNPDTAQRVKEAIKELNYKTNIFAKNLKSQSTKQIGVLVTDICGLFFPYVIKEICREANKNGYTVTLVDSGADIELERKGLATLADSCVDGIILSSAVLTEQKEEYAAWLWELLSAGAKRIPLVMMERDFTAYGIDSICTDTYTGGLKAMEHLIGLGCSYIAHITTPYIQEGRYFAYRTALENHQIPYRRDYVETGDYTHESGYLCMKEILSKKLPLDGVFVSNDQMALGAVAALREAGRRIPEDVKVIGFDDVFICESMEPTLSSVHIDKELLGRKSISLLLDRLQEKDVPYPYKETVESRLVVRGSTDKNAVMQSTWECR